MSGQKTPSVDENAQRGEGDTVDGLGNGGMKGKYCLLPQKNTMYICETGRL